MFSVLYLSVFFLFLSLVCHRIVPTVQQNHAVAVVVAMTVVKVFKSFLCSRISFNTHLELITLLFLYQSVSLVGQIRSS